MSLQLNLLHSYGSRPIGLNFYTAHVHSPSAASYFVFIDFDLCSSKLEHAVCRRLLFVALDMAARTVVHAFHISCWWL